MINWRKRVEEGWGKKEREHENECLSVCTGHFLYQDLTRVPINT